MRNILVSGASGVVGYGILRSLRKSGESQRLIGTTIYDDSVAQGFCDIFEQAPKTHDAGYMDWLLDIIKKHSVDFVIPGIEVDLYKWVEHVSTIEHTSAKVLLNKIDLILLCKDKWLFYESFRKSNTAHVIETSLVDDFDDLMSRFGLPFLLKPRSGYGSRGIVKIDTVDTFVKHKNDIGSILMAQPIIGSDSEEFTTSAFCDGKGGFFARMTLRRKLSKDGFTEKAEVVELREMDDALGALCEYFKPVGPTNFQFRRHDGILKLLEINPRISSSTSIRTAFGYNECQMAVDYYLDNKEPAQPFIKHGRAVRYMEDFIFYENRSNL